MLMGGTLTVLYAVNYPSCTLLFRQLQLTPTQTIRLESMMYNVLPFVVSFIGLLILYIWKAYSSNIVTLRRIPVAVISLSALINVLCAFYYNMLYVCTSCYVKLPIGQMALEYIFSYLHLFIVLKLLIYNPVVCANLTS